MNTEHYGSISHVPQPLNLHVNLLLICTSIVLILSLVRRTGTPHSETLIYAGCVHAMVNGTLNLTIQRIVEGGKKYVENIHTGHRLKSYIYKIYSYIIAR